MINQQVKISIEDSQTIKEHKKKTGVEIKFQLNQAIREYCDKLRKENPEYQKP